MNTAGEAEARLTRRAERLKRRLEVSHSVIGQQTDEALQLNKEINRLTQALQEALAEIERLTNEKGE